MPVVFKQELQTSEAECVPKRRMSSWGFLSFMIAVTNAVINISNNVNNNLNNNNQNSNNQVCVTYCTLIYQQNREFEVGYLSGAESTIYLYTNNIL